MLNKRKGKEGWKEILRITIVPKSCILKSLQVSDLYIGSLKDSLNISLLFPLSLSEPRGKGEATESRRSCCSRFYQPSGAPRLPHPRTYQGRTNLQYQQVQKSPTTKKILNSTQTKKKSLKLKNPKCSKTNNQVKYIKNQIRPWRNY